MSFQDSVDGSIHSNHAPVLRAGDVVDHGAKTIAIVALFVVIAALVVAMVALVRAEAGKELAEARYADLVARNGATTDMARLAERNSTVAVERSHDLMARTGRLENKAGIYSTDH